MDRILETHGGVILRTFEESNSSLNPHMWIYFKLNTQLDHNFGNGNCFGVLDFCLVLIKGESDCDCELFDMLWW